MKSQGKRPQRKKKQGSRPTYGRDDMVSNTSRKDYYVANALEITPHPNQLLRSALRQPVMNRKLKYSISETSLVSSGATSATPLSLVSINQGTTDITRTGDRVRAKRLWLKGFAYGAAAAGAPALVRIVVVVWNPVGTGAVNAPVASQIIQHSATYGPLGSYSRDFGDSFQVVYDCTLATNPLAATSEHELFHMDREILVDMEFTAGATTPTTNNFYIFALSNLAANTPTVFFSSTLWYEDLDA